MYFECVVTDYKIVVELMEGFLGVFEICSRTEADLLKLLGQHNNGVSMSNSIHP